MLVKTQVTEFNQELKLDSGKALPKFTIAYETYGTLNQQKDNTILICHSLSMSAHAAFKNKADDKKPGWWDIMIGPGKPIDTDKFFVICTNVIGGCDGSTGPSSINPKTGKPYSLDFPMITINDMVRAQKILLDHLKISSLYSVTGGSMGGMQALAWTILYPNFVKTAMIIAATSRLSDQAIAFNAVGRHAITSDPNWQNGNYYGKAVPKTGLAIARMIGHITYLSDESMEKKFGRQLQEKNDYSYKFETDFQVESYLEHQGKRFGLAFDANSYLYISKAIDYFDLEREYGSLEKAFKKTKAKFLFITFSSDWLFPTAQSKKMIQALVRNNKSISSIEIDTNYGHDAFLLSDEHFENTVKEFLNSNIGDK